ncbi:MAG: cytochrome d ubiquinol oxidase subunit II [Cyanobacteria bacterium REEB67]|nr:cytochrome d ubiquinol oxidase subunit II [Cyanobacteria bacterium REEB67]
MEALWYGIVAVMLSIYVVLDGFDFGVGILHLFVAKTDAERRQLLNAIGPFWNGNEVWLLSAGGLLVFAFPAVYAAGFSGFYLPLMMVLWLLVLRGLAIEFRSKEENKLWRTFWDMTFFVSSLLMAIVLGAALGNVIRGVPLGKDGYFDGALFTNFQPGVNPGILDWYTVPVGVFAAITLAAHGASFLVWKTTGELHARALKAALPLWTAVVTIGVIVTFLTHLVRPQLYQTLMERPWTFVFAVSIILSLFFVFRCLKSGKELPGFLASAIFIISMLAATAAGMYPQMLISTVDPAFSMTAQTAAIGSTGLRLGLTWWIPSVILAILYFANLYRTFAAKTEQSDEAYGH